MADVALFDREDTTAGRAFMFACSPAPCFVPTHLAPLIDPMSRWVDIYSQTDCNDRERSAVIGQQGTNANTLTLFRPKFSWDRYSWR